MIDHLLVALAAILPSNEIVTLHLPKVVRPSFVDRVGLEQTGVARFAPETLANGCGSGLWGTPLLTIDGSVDRLVVGGLTCGKLGVAIEPRADDRYPSPVNMIPDPTRWLDRAQPGSILLAQWPDDGRLEGVPPVEWLQSLL